MNSFGLHYQGNRFVVREVAKELETIGALAKNRNTFK
jgi:hypothetical protein